MSVPYFYEPLLVSLVSDYILSEESSKHSIQVLRLKEGDRIDLTNGQGVIFEAVIQIANKKAATVHIQAHSKRPAPQQKITLGISLLKNAARLEWLLEKATEMGIHSFVPLICERTIHERFKMDRMQHILQSAMLQSQQAWMPQLHQPLSFIAFIDTFQGTQKLIAHCEPTQKLSIKGLSVTDDCLIIIGPEGDFTPAEIKEAEAKNYQSIHLGDTRLRTETAGLFAISVLKKF